MSGINYRAVEGSPEKSHVALVPCPSHNDLGFSHFPCGKSGPNHRHIFIAREASNSIFAVPARVESRAFLTKALEFMVANDMISELERDAVLALPEARELEEDVTEYEQRNFLDDSNQLEVFTRFYRLR